MIYKSKKKRRDTIVPDDFSVIFDAEMPNMPPPFHYRYEISFSRQYGEEIRAVITWSHPYDPNEYPWSKRYVARIEDFEPIMMILRDRDLLTDSWMVTNPKPRPGQSRALIGVMIKNKQLVFSKQLTPDKAKFLDSVLDEVISKLPVLEWYYFVNKQKSYEQAYFRAEELKTMEERRKQEESKNK